METKSASSILATVLYLTSEKLLLADKLPAGLAVSSEIFPILGILGFNPQNDSTHPRPFLNALETLKLSKIIRVADDIDMDKYSIGEDSARHIAAEILPLFTPAELSDLSRVASIVRESCRV